jgi:hypothetical protein
MLMRLINAMWVADSAPAMYSRLGSFYCGNGTSTDAIPMQFNALISPST